MRIGKTSSDLVRPDLTRPTDMAVVDAAAAATTFPTMGTVMAHKAFGPWAEKSLTNNDLDLK